MLIEDYLKTEYYIEQERKHLELVRLWLIWIVLPILAAFGLYGLYCLVGGIQ